MHKLGEKQVMIPQSLFGRLVKYFLIHDSSEEKIIVKQLEQKLDQLIKHQSYTEYKQEKDPVKQEKARKQYLDQAGIPNDFRW